jgi:hypothetical protein
MVHRQRGYDRMNDIVEELSDIAKLEVAPRQTGRRMTMMLAPDKAKIEQIKRREAKAESDRENQPAESDRKDEEEKSGTDGERHEEARRSGEADAKSDEPSRESLEAARSD